VEDAAHLSWPDARAEYAKLKLAVYAVLSTAEGVSLARISHDMPADPARNAA
jgi:hypothetical protein